jgi:4-hydroxy-L-threonine phosphate dehydrogenase PdxA
MKQTINYVGGRGPRPPSSIFVRSEEEGKNMVVAMMVDHHPSVRVLMFLQFSP